MKMFKGVRYFIRLVLTVATILTLFVIGHAGTVAPVAEAGLSSKDIILILLALLQTMFGGLVVWLLTNDKEIFKRLGSVETNQQVRDKLCEDRNKGGSEHHHSREQDRDPMGALIASLDSLRSELHKAGVGKPAED